MSYQHPARKPTAPPDSSGVRNSEISAIRPALGSLPPGRVTSIPPSEPGLWPKKRILLIEPTQSAAQLHQTMLAAWFEVVTEAEPLAALQHFTSLERPYAMVICNVESPTISGFEFVRRMKLDPIAKATPIVLFNGEENSADVIRAIQLGVRHYVGRTTSAGELAQKVYGLLYRR